MADPAHRSLLSRWWHSLLSPSVSWSVLALTGLGLVVGIALSGVTWGALYYTGTDEFCSSCHANNVVPEWKASPHYVNAQGFRAGCADCHEPRDPVGFVLRKTVALNEIWHQMLGTISTPEKFEAHRLELAQNEWARLRASNSQACRNCHHVEQMNNPAKAALGNMHRTIVANGQVCTDCHKGVAHKAPAPAAASSGAKS